MSVFQKAHGLDPGVRYPERRKRILARVDVDHRTGCWVWKGYRDDRGYPRLGSNHAHRAAYEEFVGQIPDGLHLDHLCRNVSCVYPGHLEPVTQAENNRRSWAVRDRSTCRRGHDRSLYGVRHPGGQIECRLCSRIARQRRKEVAR